MGKAHRPRAGSRMIWPRKRAKKSYTRIRNMSIKALHFKDAKPLGFGGYKAGMTHAIIIDNRAKSLTKGTGISVPVTVLECPPMRVASIRLYKRDTNGMHVVSEIFYSKPDKDLSRKMDISKKSDSEKKLQEAEQKIDSFQDIRVIVHTRPGSTGFGKKKPDVFELPIGGNVKEKFNWAKEHLGKEIGVENIFSPGNQVDVHGVTKGKGFQGPVKRFGVTLRSHKSEKTRRGPANLGSWTPHHVGWEIAHAGQMGYHARTDYNKIILKISNKTEEINPKGGFVKYGLVRSPYVLVRGSVPGCPKRLVIFTCAIRPDKVAPKDAAEIEYINIESKQKR